ncbi:MAG: DUF1801 domain-containing protein [Bacteroidetes bacterium]|nr:DUF1801 domain-containing protein [Bacteroidota bacterium]
MSANEFIFNIENKTQKEIVIFLNDLLLSIPGIYCKKNYNIPFYYKKSWICYINLSKKQKDVELCFIRGVELSNEYGLLDLKKRKQIAGITFKNLSSYPLDQVKETINEAIILDEISAPKASKKKIKKKE